MHSYWLIWRIKERVVKAGYKICEVFVYHLYCVEHVKCWVQWSCFSFLLKFPYRVDSVICIGILADRIAILCNLHHVRQVGPLCKLSLRLLDLVTWLPKSYWHFSFGLLPIPTGDHAFSPHKLKFKLWACCVNGKYWPRHRNAFDSATASMGVKVGFFRVTSHIGGGVLENI